MERLGCSAPAIADEYYLPTESKRMEKADLFGLDPKYSFGTGSWRFSQSPRSIASATSLLSRLGSSGTLLSVLRWMPPRANDDERSIFFFRKRFASSCRGVKNFLRVFRTFEPNKVIHHLHIGCGARHVCCRQVKRHRGLKLGRSERRLTCSAPKRAGGFEESASGR